MGTLTDTLKDLKDEMRGIKEQVSHVEDCAPNQTRLISSGATSATASSGAEPSDWWYAVGKGKHGASGVFSSWAEASSFVVGISGAIAETFRDTSRPWSLSKRVRSSPSLSPRTRSLSMVKVLLVGPPIGPIGALEEVPNNLCISTNMVVECPTLRILS